MKRTHCLTLLFYLCLPSLLLYPSGTGVRAQTCTPLAQATLEGGNVSALITSGGDLWGDGSEGRYRIRARQADGTLREFSSFFAGALWLASTAPDGTLNVAAPTYGRGIGRTDYGPGPLLNGVTTTDNCANWDLVFPMTREEVEFVRTFPGNLLLEESDLSEALRGWPARGNPHFERIHGFALPDRAEGLAPFFDQDGDGNYEPLDRDYPLIQGDRALFTVFNDGVLKTDSNSPGMMGAEVHLLAYAYDRPGGGPLNATTVYEYTVHNYGDTDWRDCYVSLWNDADLGCFTNDRFGTSPARDLAYVYNDTPDEGETCVAGIPTSGNLRPVTMLQLLDATDEPGTDADESRLHSIGGYYSSAVGQLGLVTEPANKVEIFDVMRGRWRDGTPIRRGGIGYGGTGDTTRFIFDGGATPDGTPWDNCTDQAGVMQDIRLVPSVGPYTVARGERRTVRFAVSTLIGVPYVGTCPDTNVIFFAADEVRGADSTALATTVRTVRSAAKIGLEVYPNPVGNDLLTVTLPAPRRILSAKLYDVHGRMVRSAVGGEHSTTTLPLHQLPAAFYTLRVATDAGTATRRIIRR